MESKQCQAIEATIGGNSLGIAKKAIITFNNDGVPTCPSQNIWIVVLKSHVFQLLEMAKLINNQHMDRLQLMMSDLDKQFIYTYLGLNFNHMRIIVRRILKMR